MVLDQQQAQARIQQGLAALQGGQAAEARQIFDGLIGEGVVNASIWLAKAYACRELGDDDACRDAVDQSIALEPRNPRAYLLKAQKFDADGDQRAASIFYLKALNMAPPAEQTPPDLKPQLEAARARYQAIVKSFEDFLLQSVEDTLAGAGEAGRRAALSVDYLLGRKQPYFQQPKTYFFPELPHIEFFDHSEFDWVPALEAATDDILGEVQALIADENAFSPYLSTNDARPESDPHGMRNNDDWAAYFLWKDGVLQEENAARCPKTIAALNKVPLPFIEGRAPNVLFSRLKPHSKIPPHNGLVNTRLICHLPLIVPPGCGFRVGNEVRDWKVGKFWAFDDTVEHEAWNDSDEIRYILLFEIWRPELTALERDLVGRIMQSINSYADSGL